MTMKRKSTLIPVILISLMFGTTSCSIDTKTMYLSSNYVYGSLTISSEAGDIPIADLTFDNSHLGTGFEKVKSEMPRDILAGDCLEIRYTGEITNQETYPGTLILDGELKSFTFHKATIHSIHSDESYITEEDFKIFSLDDNNVITSEKFEYKTLQDTKYSDIWYTQKWEYIDPNDNTIYGPSLIHISSLFAFNPRESS